MVTNHQRLDSITTLRAVAALLVCLIHIGIATDFHTSGIMQTIINEGQSGVGIFFIISGFVLPYSLFKRKYVLKNFFTFLTSRIIRIDPPYWASILIVFFLGLQPLSALSFKSVFLHLTYLVPFFKDAKWFSDVYWTLAIEFQYYVIIGLAYPFLKLINSKLSVASVLIPAIICIALKFNMRGVIFTNLYSFSIGFIIYLWYIKNISTKFFVWVVILFSIFIMLSISFKTGLLPLLTASFIALYKDELSFKPVLFVGNLSYSLYLIHVPVSVLFVRLVHHEIHNTSILFSLCLLLSLIFAYFLNRLIEKPAMKLSKLFQSRIVANPT